MLYGFSCKNYASYNDECILNMQAGIYKDYSDTNTITNKQGKILKSALIHGPNGGGKSNLIKAILYMQSLVIGSVIDQRLIKTNEPFMFSVQSKELPTSFEMRFIINDILYTYGFDIYKDAISKEWLYKKNERETLLFERTSHDYKSITLNSDFKKAEDIKKYTRNDALFLTTAAMLNVYEASEIINYFSGLNIITNTNTDYNKTIEYIEENPKVKEIVLGYLKKADIGIDGIEFTTENGIKINTKHSVYDADKGIIGETILPFEYQSNGTKKLLNLLGQVLKSLHEGKTIIIDEIDSKLHPSIVRFIMSLFNSTDKNKNSGQLICTTHDAILLQEKIRRDQIWFVEKNEYGESKLYSLADFKGTRKNDDILKKYLLGAYGAIPFKTGPL